MEDYGVIISTGETPDWSTRAFWKSNQSSSSKAGGTGVGNDEFCLTNYAVLTSEGSLICHNLTTLGPTA
jgi:hypothetical protein